MGTPERRYVARAIPGSGWRIWDRKLGRWWGNLFAAYPADLLDELNGAGDPKRLTALARSAKPIPKHPR